MLMIIKEPLYKFAIRVKKNIYLFLYVMLLFTSVSYCRMIDFKLFENWWAATFAFLRSLLMSFFYGIVSATDAQTAKTSAFIEVVTPVDDHLIKYIWLSAPSCYLPLMDAKKVYFFIHCFYILA